MKKILINLDRGEEWEKERERNIDWLPLARPPAGDLACSPGMCNRELNLQPFRSQAGAQSTELH